MKLSIKHLVVWAPSFWIVLLLLLLAGCKSSKTVVKVSAEPTAPSWLSSKVQLTVPSGDGTITLGGTMKMKAGERIQLSVLMPIIRSEVARIDITPEEVLVVDRMNKRYLRASRAELQGLLPENADYGKLEQLLLKASQPGGKAELTGRELGLPKMEKAKVKLYDFSDVEFNMTPTTVSSKYTPMELEDLIKILPKL